MLIFLLACASSGVESELASMPGCTRGSRDGGLDIAGGCVDGFCTDMTLGDAEAVAGPARCESIAGYSAVLWCSWDVGFGAYFWDDEMDGALDPSALSDGIWVFDPYTGGTSTGLAVGASMACFTNDLDTPDGATFLQAEEDFVPSMLSWADGTLEVYDDDADSLVDWIYMRGALAWSSL